jgi:NitT/TauT family transport system permease protein
MNKKRTDTYISILSSFVLILIWELGAALLGASIILPTPLEVLKELANLVSSQDFVANLGFTILRALESFIIIVITGGVAGILAGRFHVFNSIIRPLVTVFKATPVMSVILLAYIWLRTGAVPAFSAFLMAFPVMFVQTMAGYQSIDTKLLAMCQIYDIKGKERIKHLIIPSLLPYLITGAKQTLSMIWKVVIAAEVLTLPKHGVGRALQLAQIQLETAKVFAWTIVAILLTALGDFIFNAVLKWRFGNAN